MLSAVVVIIFVAIIVAVLLHDRKKAVPDDTRGEEGERIVAQILGENVPGKQYVINDLLFSDKGGRSCQIDHVVINRFGIWVIETKNMFGKIRGSEEEREWTRVSTRDGEEHKFYNPIKQNVTHIYRLSEYLNIPNVFQSIVVFLYDADLSDLTAPNVYSVRELESVITQNTGICLSAEQMKYCHKKLLSLKEKSKVNKAKHIKNIHKMQRKVQKGKCPRCGGKLVLRQGTNGEFWGCTNFPDCRFSKKRRLIFKAQQKARICSRFLLCGMCIS